MKQKFSKKYANPLFIFLWLAAYVIAFAMPEILELLLRIPLYFGLPSLSYLGAFYITVPVSFFMLALSISVIQKAALSYRFQHDFKAWVFWNVLAWMTYVPVQIVLISSSFNGITYTGMGWNFLLTLALIMPIALAQAWVLRNHIKQSWLLPLAGLGISGILSIFGYNAFGYWGLPLYSMVHAIFLLWMFARSQIPDKQKIAQAQETQRLQDSAEEANDEIYEDSAYDLSKL